MLLAIYMRRFHSEIIQATTTSAMADKVTLPSKYKEGRTLGRGAFGEVVKLQDEARNDLGLVAKKIPSYQALKEVNDEIDILKKLSHERVVRYMGAYHKGAYFYIVMEYVPGGTLGKRIQEIGCFDEKRAKKYTKQILQGLRYIHSREVIHKDLKAENILLTRNHDIKLADFGVSTILRTTIRHGVGEAHAGTLYYMSPEMLLGEKYRRRTDIWSLGCTLVEMLSGSPPWAGRNEMQIRESMRYGKRPDYSLPGHPSNEARSFLHGCFIYDRHARPKAADLLHHPYIR